MIRRLHRFPLTLLYAVMHFFVDLICAWGMFAVFRRKADGYFYLLVYNFCAFALQMPFGALLDVIRSRAGERLSGVLPWIIAGLGAGLTAAGVFTNPWVLGAGNALFHVGGGLAVMDKDLAENRNGKDLGLFVAPGALGLHLGKQWGTAGIVSALWVSILCLAALVLAAIPGTFRKRRNLTQRTKDPVPAPGLAVICLGCFAVVILRSMVGFYTDFSWKGTKIPELICVLFLAGGKALGGLCQARLGIPKTIFASLGLAALLFLPGESPVFGLAAILLFNMTMPVTLYILADSLPGLPGFSFGLLTFGLFLGFLPLYAGLPAPLPPWALGAVGSGLSLVILLLCCEVIRRGRVLS